MDKIVLHDTVLCRVQDIHFCYCLFTSDKQKHQNVKLIKQFKIQGLGL